LHKSPGEFSSAAASSFHFKNKKKSKIQKNQRKIKTKKNESQIKNPEL
jgi:hypothetical protein